MRPARYIRLAPVETGALERVYRQTEKADLRARCQMILLSVQRCSAAEIAELTFFDQDMVLFWFDRYEAEGLTGLEDRPHSGRPPKSGRSRKALAEPSCREGSTACRQARTGQIILLFEDAIDLNLLPGVLRCWTRRGCQRKVPTPGLNEKRYAFGAVNFVKGHLTRHIAKRKNSDGFCALIEQIVQADGLDDTYQGPKVVLVISNYIIHRSKKTLHVLAKYAKHLEVVALPTYVPKPKLIELLWKHLRRKVTHNHLFESVAQLIDAVNDFICRIDAKLTEVLSVMGCSGQLSWIHLVLYRSETTTEVDATETYSGCMERLER